MQNELRKSNDTHKWALISNIEPSSVGCRLCPVSDEKVEETMNIKNDKGVWIVKSIVDPYPVTIPTVFKLKEENPFESYNAHGWSEVVVETREHQKDFSELTPEEIKNVLEIYSNRTKELLKRDGVAFVGIAKDNLNTEFEHSYSKIFTLPVIPGTMAEKMQRFEDYTYKHEKCMYCDLIKKEKESSRFIMENEHFMAFTPFSQGMSNQIDIFPKKHISCISQIDELELFELAETIKNILTRFSVAFRPLKYGIVFYSKPNKSSDFHFHISIFQKILKDSITEGYDLAFSRSPPEATAKIIRGK